MSPARINMAAVNKEGRALATHIIEELIALREAAATCLRYMDGEVVEGLRDNRHTREVVANIAEHQSRNLREAVERTGPLTSDGYATRQVRLGSTSVLSFGGAANEEVPPYLPLPQAKESRES